MQIHFSRNLIFFPFRSAINNFHISSTVLPAKDPAKFSKAIGSEGHYLRSQIQMFHWTLITAKEWTFSTIFQICFQAIFQICFQAIFQFLLFLGKIKYLKNINLTKDIGLQLTNWAKESVFEFYQCQMKGKHWLSTLSHYITL